MAIYTPGMGSAQSVGQLPVEKTAYDTKNRMMQMDMMGMRSKAMADAALKAKKTQEEKDLLAIKAGDAGYFQEIYNEKDINPAIKNLLTLKQQGMLTEPNKLAVVGDLDSKAKQYKVLDEETQKSITNALAGMEKVYDPGALLASVKEKQFSKLRANQQYTQTDIQADVEEAKKNLKSLQSSNINKQFVDNANTRKNVVEVSTDRSGLRKIGKRAEAQSYWKIDQKTGKINGFDFDGFYGDYTTPGTPTQQLYAANKVEALKDPNFEKQYNELRDKITTQYSSDPAKLQSALHKLDAEKFIFPYFGGGERWDDFFYRSQKNEDIRQYVAPTERQLEKQDAEYAGAPQVEIVVSPANGNRQTASQTSIGAQMTREQAQNFKPDTKYAYTLDEYGRLVPSAGISNIAQGADQSYSIVARTSLNTDGIKIYDKSGKLVNPNSLDFSKRFKKSYLSSGSGFSNGGELNYSSTEEFIKYSISKGYTPKVTSNAGVEVPVQSVKDLAGIPGALQTSAYFKVSLPTGQEKPVGPAPKTTTTIDKESGKISQATGTTTINIASPGLPKEAFYPVKFGSSIKTLAQRNMGQEKLNKKIEEAKKLQMQATLNALGGAMEPSGGNAQGGQGEDFDFE